MTKYNLAIIDESKLMILDSLKNANINWKNLWKEVNEKPSITKISIFFLIMRYTGQTQQIFHEGTRNKATTEKIKHIVFNGSSQLMHGFQFESDKLISWLDSLVECTGITCKISGLSDYSIFKKVTSSQEFIRSLRGQVITKKNGKNKSFQRNVFINMLDAILIRIIFEEKVQKYIIKTIINPTFDKNCRDKMCFKDKVLKSNCYFNRNICISKIGDLVKKHKKLNSFYNQYSRIINNVSHGIGNNYYQFIDINQKILSNASEKLKLIKS